MSINYEILGKQLCDYCNKYKVPYEAIFQILEDQKVVPMVRGKATEHAVFIKLKKLLNSNEWSVVKLNLNAQPNSDDQDISVTHMRTGIIVKVECKNAVRGSFKSGKGCVVKVPHCRIKCHKSRSHMKKIDTSNDKYSVDNFDIIISNLSNSVIKGATISETFELIPQKDCLQILSNHYSVPIDFENIFNATFNDWRFARTTDLAEDGFLPRTPPMILNGDEIWSPINQLEATLLQVVQEKHNGR